MRAKPLTFKRAKVLRDLTLPEGLLWRALRNKQVAGLRFRCQHPIGAYVLDFYCPAAKLCVEVDGASHDSAAAAEHDARRDAWSGDRGMRVLRIPASAVLDDAQLEAVLAQIAAAAAPSTSFAGPPPPLRG